MNKLPNREYWKNDSRYYIEYEGKTYVREETQMINDFHIIRWYTKEEYEKDNNLLYYYSYPNGWSLDGVLHIDNPVPKIEQEIDTLK